VEYCETKSNLMQAAEDTLERLIRLARFQREALESGSEGTAAAIDQELEQTFGEKERRLGALYEHTREHGC